MEQCFGAGLVWGQELHGDATTFTATMALLSRVAIEEQAAVRRLKLREAFYLVGNGRRYVQLKSHLTQ